MQRNEFVVVALLFASTSFAKVPDCANALLAHEPSVIYGDLFHAVQTKGVFADSKYFPDMTPRDTVIEVLARYHWEKPSTTEELRAFVLNNFNAPDKAATESLNFAGGNTDEYIQKLWPALTRQAHQNLHSASSLIGLDSAYIVPGGRFREIYYWDSYFTQLGLLRDGQDQMFTDMVKIFEKMLLTYGHIPNGNRHYYRSRSQAPVFALMVALWQDRFGTQSATQFLPALKAEHAFWMRGEASTQAGGDASARVLRLEDGSLLNRYWDDQDTPRPEAYKEDLELAAHAEAAHGRQINEVYRDLRAAAESGWDFSSRWFADPDDFSSIQTTSLAPIDLNSLMYFMEQKIGELERSVGQVDLANHFDQRAKTRAHAIRRHLWNQATGTFRDYNWRTRTQSEQLTIAMTAPLFVGLANQMEAERIGKMVGAQFLKSGGVATTLRNSGQQWDAPNGWAPCQWIAFAGLKRYKIEPLAEAIRTRWSDLNEVVFARTGRMKEKYNVDEASKDAGGGEYDGQDGFGWTAGIKKAFTNPALSLRHLRVD